MLARFWQALAAVALAHAQLPLHRSLQKARACWPSNQLVVTWGRQVQGCSRVLPMGFSQGCSRVERMTLQVPVQRLLGLHCAHMVAQPPEVPVRDPLQRLGVGRVPARQQLAGKHLGHRPSSIAALSRTACWAGASMAAVSAQACARAAALSAYQGCPAVTVIVQGLDKGQCDTRPCE